MLSKREGKVLKLLGEGKSNREIAGELYITLDTVENHITRIGAQLGIRGRGKLRQWIKSRKEIK